MSRVPRWPRRAGPGPGSAGATRPGRGGRLGRRRCGHGRCGGVGGRRDGLRHAVTGPVASGAELGSGRGAAPAVYAADAGRGRRSARGLGGSRQHAGRRWRLGEAAVEVADQVGAEADDRRRQQERQDAELAERDDGGHEEQVRHARGLAADPRTNGRPPRILAARYSTT